MNRYFNTSGPNHPWEHYTLMRPDLIAKGKDLVYKSRYFTIWAPRQTGKSTYFRLLADELEKEGYRVCYVNLENFRGSRQDEFFEFLNIHFVEFWQENLGITSFVDFTNKILLKKDKKFVFICDEIEGLNSDFLNQFLHTIRNVYHSRTSHSLKSVILVGVTNITGIIQDNASPFNIADELDVPYFTDEETVELLEQHENETGQVFADDVKRKISEITANQPGLVNGFARQLVERCSDKKEITLSDYLKVEDWYLTEAIDKNVANIINKASKHRKFVEELLFIERTIPFAIGRKAIKELYAAGLIKKDINGNVEFWVPLYKKRLFDEFFPYSNGEADRIAGNIPLYDIVLDEKKEFHLDKLIENYKEYIARRSFRPFREKDEVSGEYKSIPEAVMVYSFETYIQSFLQMINAKSYREAQASLGNTDILIHLYGKEYLIEVKVYRYDKQFQDGKKQLAYYCKSLGLNEGVYLVFVPNNILYPERAKEGVENIEGVAIKVFLVRYDEEKEFGIR